MLIVPLLLPDHPAFLLRGAAPEPLTMAGIGLLVAGVIRAVRQ